MGAGGAEESSWGMVGAGVIDVPDYRQIGTGQERLVRHMLNGGTWAGEGVAVASQQPLGLMALRMFGQALPGILLHTDSQMGWLVVAAHTGRLGECTLRQVLLGPALASSC